MARCASRRKALLRVVRLIDAPILRVPADPSVTVPVLPVLPALAMAVRRIALPAIDSRIGTRVRRGIVPHAVPSGLTRVLPGSVVPSEESQVLVLRGDSGEVTVKAVTEVVVPAREEDVVVFVKGAIAKAVFVRVPPKDRTVLLVREGMKDRVVRAMVPVVMRAIPEVLVHRKAGTPLEKAQVGDIVNFSPAPARFLTAPANSANPVVLGSSVVLGTLASLGSLG